ncbi:hypothetical protein Agub_g12125, partial [Astrephomene gubernaculifera]
MTVLLSLAFWFGIAVTIIQSVAVDCHGPMASTKYHHVSARVLSVANKLRELGVESALQVPTLVIAGDQSSGKSSVVEAIAGVALPRSDGTCTRCPTEVRMRANTASAPNNQSWSC